MKSTKQDIQDERIRQQNKLKDEIEKQKRQSGDQNITIRKIINTREMAQAEYMWSNTEIKAK